MKHFIILACAFLAACTPIVIESPCDGKVIASSRQEGRLTLQCAEFTLVYLHLPTAFSGPWPALGTHIAKGQTILMSVTSQ